MGRDNAIIDTRPVRSGCYNAGQGLVGYGTEIGHGEVILCKMLVKVVQGDTSLCNDISFFGVYLKKEEELSDVG